MICNYIETAGLVSLHTVFQNLVALVITSGDTTWGYRKLQVSRKLEHGPQHYRDFVVKMVWGYLDKLADCVTARS